MHGRTGRLTSFAASVSSSLGREIPAATSLVTQHIQGIRAFISLRRGYHFFPKHIFGEPVDVFAERGRRLPRWLSQALLGRLLRLLNGDLTRLGLKAPDHKVLESHPIVNSQILHYLSHGDLTAKPNIARLNGGEVVFDDGSREPIDLIIYATGYRWELPYLQEGLVRSQDASRTST